MDIVILSGEIFNNENEGCEFYALLDKNEKSTEGNRLTYHNGLNEDTQISITKNWTQGGFNFGREQMLTNFINDSHRFIARVLIPNDAIVICDKRFIGMITNKLIVDNKVKISKFHLWYDEDFCRRSAFNFHTRKYIKKNRKELCNVYPPMDYMYYPIEPPKYLRKNPYDLS